MAQIDVHWRLYVSDDGSTDHTLSLLEKFRTMAQTSHTIDVVAGPKRGAAANFLTAICTAPSAGFYALSDQDDIWQPRKLSRALEQLRRIPEGTPALYCARTRIADRNGREVGLSPLFVRRPSFANALVQSIGGGNTMVMNRAAHELVCRAGGDLGVVVHDWWLYQLISGAGGEVIYDSEPHILYRQHGANLVGENGTFSARVRRAKQLMNGLLKSWLDMNLSALERVSHLLTVENQQLLRDLLNLRQRNCWHRVRGLQKLGISRQTLLGNVGITVAAALGKL